MIEVNENKDASEKDKILSSVVWLFSEFCSRRKKILHSLLRICMLLEVRTFKIYSAMLCMTSFGCYSGCLLIFISYNVFTIVLHRSICRNLLLS